MAELKHLSAIIVGVKIMFDVALVSQLRGAQCHVLRFVPTKFKNKMSFRMHVRKFKVQGTITTNKLNGRITALTTQSSSWSQYIANYRALRNFASKLSDLRSRIVEVSERNRRYHLDIADQAIYNNINLMSVLGNTLSRSTEGATDDWANELDVPNDNINEPKVVALVGMYGSGSTHVREIYKHQQTIKRFDSYLWITLSQDVNATKIFMDMMKQLSGDSSSQPEYTGEDELAHGIQGKLKRKQFLLVFDDLWTTQAWHSIKRALPQDIKKGSLVIVTTEIVHVAKDCTESVDHIYWVQQIPKRKSFNRLKEYILVSGNSKMTREDKEDFEDLELESLEVPEPPFNTIEQVLRKCSGLELAIQALGQLLASKPPQRWGKLCDDLPSLLYNNHPMLKDIRKVMIQRYNNLPPYLKPCFLYLSIFPENFDIKVETVVDRWLTEGLVRDRTGMCHRAVAQEYLAELFDRSMIVFSKLRKNRSCKTCWIHPMMRDILVMISQEEKVSTTIGPRKSCSLLVKRLRHVTLDGQSERKLARCVDLSGIRSLTVFNEPSESIAALICSSQLRALRVLDVSNARGFQITQKDIRSVGELRHLRYLNLYRSNICELPSSIGMLPFLQLLNVRKTLITKLPREVTQLSRIQSLRASRRTEDFCHNRRNRCCCDSGVTVPKGIENLQDIEWLDIVEIKDNHGSKIEALGKLASLKHLGLTALQWRTAKKTNLQESHIMSLERLPCLVMLALLDNSYISERLIFYAKAFRELKTLEIFRVPKLKTVIFTEEAVPQLRSLAIRYCTLRLKGENNLKLRYVHLEGGVKIGITEKMNAL
uniref:Uncharacterized protein n=1 Tax=Oryza punctata TaxID=4537 RepID=A0A0E0LSN2_ORYPU